MTAANPYANYVRRVFASGVGFPEGPTLLPNGSLYVSEMRAQRITHLFPDGSRQVLVELAGTPNGTAIDAAGRIYYCEMRRRRWVVRPYPFDWPGAPDRDLPVSDPDAPNEPGVRRFDPSAPGTEFPIDALSGSAIEGWSGTRSDGAGVSQPSDIVVDRLGNVYFTDPVSSPPGPAGVVWFKPATGEPAAVIVDPLAHPNGVALSPDEDALYVTETRTGRLWTFTLEGPGRVVRRECIMVFGSGGPFNVGGADGLTVDANGLVLVALLGRGEVAIVDPHARKVIGTLDCGDELLVTNVVVDDACESIYVTLGTTGAVLQWSRP